jgi:hypothetical protein
MFVGERCQAALASAQHGESHQLGTIGGADSPARLGEQIAHRVGRQAQRLADLVIGLTDASPDCRSWWRRRSYLALEAGHFPQEEAPSQLLAALAGCALA